LLADGEPIPVGPIPAGTMTTSDTCGSCHRDIYRMWRKSAHARSMESPVFLESLRLVEAKDSGIARTCLECHAPLVTVNDDYLLNQKITWEGVNCDVCHSLVKVNLTGPGPRQVLDVGPVKRGPVRDASSMSHEVAYSELHVTSLGCAACHEFTNGEGTPILTTYSEWKSSAAAREGKHCQACHMGRTQADVVDPRVARSSLAEVNLHEVPGGHSLDQLHKALRVAIDPEREGDELVLEVQLANKGAGHAVPTGMPGRRVILDLKVRSSKGGSFEEERIYAKSYLDAEGATIRRDGDYFAPGVRLEEDTRIQPDERRSERFRFAVPADATAFVTVKLHYDHAPTGDDENRTWITFFSENRTLPPVPPPSS